MRVDLRHPLTEGMNNLMTWRNRYSKTEYPEKVVLNIFYRKYTVEFMISELMRCFNNSVKWTDFNIGYRELKTKYGETAVNKTNGILLELLKQTDRQIGNTSYSIFQPLITSAKTGDKAKLEEIEYAYLYYFLTDECILLWAAFGGTGINKIDAIGQLSGLILETEEILNYGQIEEILGRFCAAAYLKNNYKALPPNV